MLEIITSDKQVTILSKTVLNKEGFEILQGQHNPLSFRIPLVKHHPLLISNSTHSSLSLT